MKSAAGKRPPDEAHGPGKEAIRPQQRCLGKSRKEGAHGHAALPAEARTTLIQKITPVTRGTAPGWCKKHAALKYAPNSKNQIHFVKNVRIFAILLSNVQLLFVIVH